MAERFDVALRLLVNEIKATGIKRADVDPTKLTAPCVWVSVKSFDTPTLAGTLDMATQVVIVASDWKQSQSLTQLAGDLEMVLEAIDDIDGEIEAATVSLPSSGQTNLPALIINTTLEVKG